MDLPREINFQLKRSTVDIILLCSTTLLLVNQQYSIMSSSPLPQILLNNQFSPTHPARRNNQSNKYTGQALHSAGQSTGFIRNQTLESLGHSHQAWSPHELLKQAHFLHYIFWSNLPGYFNSLVDFYIFKSVNHCSVSLVEAIKLHFTCMEYEQKPPIARRVKGIKILLLIHSEDQ